MLWVASARKRSTKCVAFSSAIDWLVGDVIRGDDDREYWDCKHHEHRQDAWPQPHDATLLQGYANPLKRLDTSESVNLHKCLILLDSCRIHATRWPAIACAGPDRNQRPN